MTEFDDGVNAFSVIDYMPRYREEPSTERDPYKKPIEIHRIIKPLRGRPSIRVIFEPRLNYALGPTEISLADNHLSANHRLENLFLYSSLPLKSIQEHEFVSLEKDHFLVLSYHEWLFEPDLPMILDSFEKKKYWESWAGECRLPSFHREEVLRSALTLKLLIYEETGAIIASPTTSLPEADGEGRNWDYRFCWLRDASFMLEALKSIGHFREARSFIHFLLEIFESKQTEIRILYSIDGREGIGEKTLPHLAGYRNNSPVRVGNAAFDQKQHDIFGEIIDTIYLYYQFYRIEPMTNDVWALVKFFVDTCAKEWESADSGIWELRGRKEHFTFSKVLAWVALDSGIKMALHLKKEKTAHQWKKTADDIRKDIETKAWSPELGSYTQSYGSSHIDAGLLLLNRYGFLEASDPRWVGTVKKCEEMLVKNNLTLRYNNVDDFGAPKKAFCVASFWMAKALHSLGQNEKGKKIFEKIVSCANHVGLLSENIDFETGELFGNFPQAYSHTALINTANLFC